MQAFHHPQQDQDLRRTAQRVLQVSLAALALSAAGAVWAQEPSPAAQPAPDRTALQSSFTKADADKDGKLSRAEASGVPSIASRFEELDRDKDGTLSMMEFMASARPAQ